jgi:hypothetical protein
MRPQTRFLHNVLTGRSYKVFREKKITLVTAINLPFSSQNELDFHLPYRCICVGWWNKRLLVLLWRWRLCVELLQRWLRRLRYHWYKFRNFNAKIYNGSIESLCQLIIRPRLFPSCDITKINFDRWISVLHLVKWKIFKLKDKRSPTAMICFFYHQHIKSVPDFRVLWRLVRQLLLSRMRWLLLRLQ